MIGHGNVSSHNKAPIGPITCGGGGIPRCGADARQALRGRTGRIASNDKGRKVLCDWWSGDVKCRARRSAWLVLGSGGGGEINGLR